MDKGEIVKQLLEEGKSWRDISERIGLTAEGARYYLPNRRRSSIRNVMEWRHRTLEKVIKIAGGTCRKCSYSICIPNLHFHHLNPKEKDFSIRCNHTISWKRVKNEIVKTILLCNRCHGEVHAGLWNPTEGMIQEQQEIYSRNMPLYDTTPIPKSRPPKEPVFCKECKGEILDPYRGQLYCSKACGWAAKKKTRPEKSRLMTLRDQGLSWRRVSLELGITEKLARTCAIEYGMINAKS